MAEKTTDDKLEAATVRGGDGTATFTIPTTAGPARREEVQRTGPHDRSEDGDQDGLSDDYERQHGTDPNHYDSDDLQRVADELNGRPRKALGWRSPVVVVASLNFSAV